MFMRQQYFKEYARLLIETRTCVKNVFSHRCKRNSVGSIPSYNEGIKENVWSKEEVKELKGISKGPTFHATKIFEHLEEDPWSLHPPLIDSRIFRCPPVPTSEQKNQEDEPTENACIYPKLAAQSISTGKCTTQNTDTIGTGHSIHPRRTGTSESMHSSPSTSHVGFSSAYQHLIRSE